MSEPEIDNSMETFMTLFNKMFSETKYNLQALNKRMESMDKCFCNVLLLTSDKPFDEENIEENNENSNNENINQDNIPKRKRNINSTSKNKKNKMTEQDLDEIEKMFRNIDDDNTPSPSYSHLGKKNQENFLNKKRKNKKTEEKNEIKDSKNLFNDIKELLKTYSLDNEDENKNESKKEEKQKGKRGRKKKNIINDSDSNEDGDVDYLVPEKNDGFSKFKEFKELKKKVGNNIYNKSSEEDDDEDDIDSDF